MFSLFDKINIFDIEKYQQIQIYTVSVKIMVNCGNYKKTYGIPIITGLLIWYKLHHYLQLIDIGQQHKFTQVKF